MLGKKHKSGKKGSEKTFAAKRTMNQPGKGSHQANTGDSNTFQQHDAANRLGGYEGAGNHARTGNRGHQ